MEEISALLKLDRRQLTVQALSGRSRSMGLQDVNSLLIISILFFTCVCTPATTQLISSRHDEQAACATANCTMGTCRETSGWGFGYTCDCYSGWTMPSFLNGVIVWPSCILPNCTIYSQCGGEPPMPPPPPFQFPPPNSSLPCLFVWCGDGQCVATGGSGYQCQCPGGSSNLMGLPTLPCLQQCNLGVDCNNLGFGPPAAPPPPPPSKSSASPGNSSSSSPPAPPRNGLADTPNCSRNYRVLSWMLLAVIVVWWI